MSKPLSTQTPVEIDTELARLVGIEYDAIFRLSYLTNRVERLLEDSKLLHERHPDRYGPDFRFHGLDEAEAEVAAYTRKRDAARAAAAPLHEEYARRPWSRFYLVTNGNGHVHSTRGCSTCFPTTQYSWVFTLSGATEEEAVKEYGETMCTVCFPSAPASKFWGEGRVGREAREAKEARKAERDTKRAEKLAKAVLHPVKGWVLYNTERSAYEDLARELRDVDYWNEQTDREDAPRIRSSHADRADLVALALATKHASNVDDEKAIARDKTRWPKIQRKAK